MSNFIVENQGVNTYLVYKISDEDNFDSLSFGMLTNNKIKGIAPVLFTQIDTEKYLKYNISSKIPVRKYIEGTITRKKLLDVFSGISSAVMTAEEYMIDTSLFVFDVDYIYVDATTNETTLICVPVFNCNHGSTDLQMFYKEIMYGAQFDQNENCDYIAPIMNYLNSTSVFSILDFKSLVDNLNYSRHNNSTPAKVFEKPSIPEPTPKKDLNSHINERISGPFKSEESKRGDIADPVGTSIPTAQSFDGNADSFKLPPVPQKVQKSKKKVKQPKAEKEITLVTLLTKFSKENLELYKAQKNNSGEPKTDKSKAKKKKTAVVDFAVPGSTPSVKIEKIENTNKSNDLNGIMPPPPKPKYENQQHAMAKNSFNPNSGAGDTTVLVGAGETTILASGGVNVQVRQSASLIRIKTGERVSVNKPRFRIGKERSYVDYFIGDNTAISRSHADIISRDGRYYLVDMNSTNGTFVDGMMISNGEEIAIDTGSRIRLANEEFEFEIR